MKKKVSFIFMSLLVMCSLFFVAPLSGTYAYEPTDIVESRYMITTDIGDNQIYLSNELAGQTTGYGSFVLDARNVTLSTTAEQGFAVAGWNITYLDDDTSEFVSADDATSNANNTYTQTVVINEEYGVNITINYVDQLRNGVKSYSTFTISRVFGDLRVEPVFEYVYNRVLVNDALTIGDISALNSIELSASETLYYNNSTTLDGVTHYTNSYILFDDDLFYYGDVYSENLTTTTDGTSETTTRYYTLHYSSSLSSSGERVDYSLGAYRMGESVNYNLNVATSDVADASSVNIQVYSSEIETSEGTTILANTGSANYYSITTDNYLRTSSFYANFVVSYSSNLINALNIDYYNLHLATLVVRIDGEIASGSAESDILDQEGVINVLNYYSKINNKQYFVKSEQDNNGFALRVSTVQTVSKMIDGVIYNYYEFVSLDNASETYKIFYAIEDDFNIVFEYSSVDYTIDFAFALRDKNGGEISVLDGEFNLEEPIFAHKGETVLINKTDISNNAGYAFLGFALGTIGFEENNSIYVTIDAERPADTTVIMVYELEDYTIILRNYNRISLSYNQEVYYPIIQLDFTHTRLLTTNTYTISAEDLASSTNQMYNMPATVNLNDRITINVDEDNVNTGFYIQGYKLSDSELEDMSLGGTFNLNITQDLISQYADGTNIYIYVWEDYNRYTITYYINPSLDTNLNQNLVMADIDVYSAPEHAVIEKDFDDNTTIDYSVAHTITISNLMWNDEVVLTSTGRTQSNVDGEEYRYTLVAYTTNEGLTSLDAVLSGNSYLCSISIRETEIADVIVRVIYSMQTSQMFISQNLPDAYDISQTTFFRNDEAVDFTFDANTNLYSIMAEDGEIEVVVDPASIEFGYRFIGYTYSIGDAVGTTTSTLNTTFTIQTIGSTIQYLTLNFEVLEYRLQVSQTGANYDNELVDFDGNNYTTISVSNLTVEFDKPIGYYVAQTSFINADNESVLNSEIVESNLDITNTFSYEFTLEQWESIVRDYGVAVENEDYVLVRMNVLYNIYTFSVTVYYELNNPRGDQYDSWVSFPNIALSYTLDNITDSVEGTRNGRESISFTGVPYGARIALNLIEDIPAGFSASTNWTDMNDVRFNQTYNPSATQLTIPTINSNLELKYKLDYVSYTIRLNYDSNRGTPEILVNNVATNSISLFDSFEISMNANQSSGFQFEYMTYYRQEYSQYTYDETTWNENALSLYIYTDGNYVLNESYEYDPNLTYYSLMDVQITFNSGNTYLDDLFYVSNYKIENGTITFSIVYDYIEVTINNTSFNLDNLFNLNIGNQTIISPSEYVTYHMWVVPNPNVNGNSSGTQTEEIEIYPGDMVDYRDNVIIRVQFNNVTLDGREINLSRGITLNNVIYLELLDPPILTCNPLENSVYSYEIVVPISSIIEKIPEDRVIEIAYYYEVQSVSVTATTNIDSPSFYYNTNGRLFDIEGDGLITGGSILSTNDNAVQLVYESHFLSYVTFNYRFSNTQYFKITGINVYDSNGNQIEEFDAYGVATQYSSEDSTILSTFTVRYLDSIRVEFIVQPIIVYNGAEVIDGDYVFTKVYDCEVVNGVIVGTPQGLTIGSDNGADIQVGEFILNAISGVYFTTETSLVSTPTNVGRYELHFNFNSTAEFDWTNEIVLDYQVYLAITPLDVQITYNNMSMFEKTYDGLSSFDPGRVLQYLVITDTNGEVFSMNYSNQNNFSLTNDIAGMITYTDSNGQEIETSRANESVRYNIHLINLAFTRGGVSNNFNLTNSTLTILGVMRINRKPVSIIGIDADDKVFDGTTSVTLSGMDNISLRGLVSDDDVSLVLDNMVISFENADIGEDKTIIVQSDNTLTGEDASNYTLNEVTGITASIYPYQISTTVEGYGEITVINERGLTDKTKVALIPIGATLNVHSYWNDSQEFLSIYNIVVNYLTNRRVLAIGLELSFMQGGVETSLPNDLYISLPTVDRLTNVVYLTGETTGDLTYTAQEDEGTILVDLSQFEANVDTLLLIRQRPLLQLWQILLIVFLLLLLIIIIIIIIIITRRRRKEKDSVNDKI